MRQHFIGAHIKDTRLICFVKQGIPVHHHLRNISGLILLFRDETEYRNYIAVLQKLKNNLQPISQQIMQKKAKARLNFVNMVIGALSYDISMLSQYMPAEIRL